MASDTEDQDTESGGKSADCNGKHPHEDHDKTSKCKTKKQPDSKGKMTVVVASKPDVKTVEVCQKAFMNIYGITEKRIRLQREKLIARLRNSSSKTVTSAEEITTLAAIDHPHDIAMVDSFFQNQLWKPEYIGPPVDLTESNVIKA